MMDTFQVLTEYKNMEKIYEKLKQIIESQAQVYVDFIKKVQDLYIRKKINLF